MTTNWNLKIEYKSSLKSYSLHETGSINKKIKDMTKTEKAEYYRLAKAEQRQRNK